MKWKVEYEPKIHDELQAELDENYESMEKYVNKEIKPRFNRNTFFLWNYTVKITEKIKERINEEITKDCMFKHENIKLGEQEIEFKSYIDILPSMIAKPFKKMLTKKIDKPLRKHFNKNIISVEVIEEVKEK